MRVLIYINTFRVRRHGAYGDIEQFPRSRSSTVAPAAATASSTSASDHRNEHDGGDDRDDADDDYDHHDDHAAGAEEVA